MVGEQTVDHLAPAGQPPHLAGQVAHSVEVGHRGGVFDGRGQLGAVHRTDGLVVGAGAERADAVGMLGIVDHQQIAEVHLVGVLSPPGPQAALPGLLGDGHLDLVDPNRPSNARPIGHLASNSQPHQPVEQIVGVHRPQLYAATVKQIGVCQHGFLLSFLPKWGKLKVNIGA